MALATEGPSRNPTPLQPHRARPGPLLTRSVSSSHLGAGADRGSGQQGNLPRSQAPGQGESQRQGNSRRPVPGAGPSWGWTPAGQALPVSTFHPQGRLPGHWAAAAWDLQGHCFPQGLALRSPQAHPQPRHPGPPGGSRVVPSGTAGHRPGPAPAGTEPPVHGQALATRTGHGQDEPPSAIPLARRQFRAACLQQQAELVPWQRLGGPP